MINPSVSRQPTVSVLMPARNARPWIGEAIASVQAQSFQNWELIIVDDASTDGTGEVLCAVDDPRIRHLQINQIGHPAGVRNRASEEAKGSFLAFLDADDRYLPNALETLLLAFEQQPDAFAVYGFCQNVDEMGRPLGGDVLIRNGDGTLALPPWYSHDWRNILLGDFSCLLPALMIRRDAFEALGRFDERFYSTDDLQFYIRMFLYGSAGVVCLPAYVYAYRHHPKGITKATENTDRILASGLAVIDWTLSQPILPPEIRSLRSLAHVRRWHYLARERLQQHMSADCRRLAWAARQDAAIKGLDWLRWCGPLLVRSLLPSGLNDALIAGRAALRRRLAARRFARSRFS